MLGSWVAIIWMTWKIVQDARAVVRSHRNPVKGRTVVPQRNRAGH